MFSAILKGNIHVWQGNQFMLSYEDTKTLQAFDTLDDVINSLFLNGYKEQARELNDRKKLKENKKCTHTK